MLSLDSGLSKGDKPSAAVAQLSEDRNNTRVFRLIQLSVPCMIITGHFVSQAQYTGFG